MRPLPTVKSKTIDKVLALMKVLPCIRNSCLIGHVDHGKTTLSDSLLASSGLLNPQLAGTARLLDFLDEEQKRGITIKTANISLVFTSNGEDLLVNLVDTPGHVDFSGKVTRALRLVDAAIVIVDAVEGVMIQTEHVVRQALDNAVRPLLYINKIDRLIKELALDQKEIQKRFKTIIDAFNALIDARANDDTQRGWKVDLQTDTVAFGSALDGWGSTLSQYLSKFKFKSFSAIIDAYQDHGSDASRIKALKEKLPVHAAILDMLVKNAPDPVAAQAYRIPKIWEGPVESDLGTAMTTCDAGGPVVVFVSRVQMDHGQTIATGRVFSGVLRSGTEVVLLRNGTKARVDSIGVFMGQRMVQVDEVPAGNIVAIKGLKECKSGETLLDAHYEGDAGGSLAFDQMSYLMEPVVTVAIEPEKLADLKKLEEVLVLKTIEDPNLKFEVSPETGEVLLSGIGPLHLEVICNEIKQSGIPVIISDPVTVFHESIERPSESRRSTSTNGKNSIVLRVSPLPDAEGQILRSINLGTEKTGITKHAKARLAELGLAWPEAEIEGLVSFTTDNNAIILLSNPQASQLAPEDESAIVSAISGTFKHGPIVGESIRGLKVVVETVDLASDPDDKDAGEVVPMVREAIFMLMNEASAVLLEPFFESTIYGSMDNIGKLSSLISQYFGKVESMDQEGASIKLRALFPVRASFAMIEDARNQTSGRAVFQNVFAGYERVPKHITATIIADLKAKKGIV